MSDCSGVNTTLQCTCAIRSQLRRRTPGTPLISSSIDSPGHASTSTAPLLHERLASAAEKLHEYKKSHPDVTRQDIIKAVASHRTELRTAVEHLLTPEQLKKWDAEVAKAKEFLGFAAA